MLPVEIYQSIIQHVRNRFDLFSLLTTSRTCNAVAERQLYHSLDILHDAVMLKNEREGEEPKLSWSVLNRVKTCKRVALFVNNLKYTIANPERSEVAALDFRKLVSFLGALFQMDNLKVLHILNLSANCIRLNLHFHKKFPFQLHTFSLRGSEKERTPAVFLKFQSQIRDLNCYLPEDITFYPRILPHLRSLSFPVLHLPSTLQHLITECPSITHIQTRQNLDHSLAQLLSQSRSPIVALSTPDCCALEVYLSEYFPHLRFLECSFDLDQRSRSINNLSQLNYLTRLRIQGLKEEVIANLVPDILTCNSSLIYIDEMVSSEEGFIWERGKGRQEEVVSLLWHADL